MDDESLLIHTLDDLARRVEPNQSEYEILRAAGLLRQLLIDSRPLAPAIAKRYGILLRFAINATPAPWEEIPGLPPFDLWILNDGIYPPDAVRHYPETVDLAGLLAARIMVVKGDRVTVKDLIRHVAHVEGAIHAGTPKEDIQRVLYAISPYLEIAGYRFTITALQGIIRVVLAGLTPLKEKVTIRRAFDGSTATD